MRILLLCTLAALLLSCQKKTDGWIRINQLGYRTNDLKIAVFTGLENENLKSFRVIETESGKTVLKKKGIVKSFPLSPFKSCYRLDFSGLSTDGTYRIDAGNTVSPDFRISDDVYDGTADFLLNYMRQQTVWLQSMAQGFMPYT